MGSQVCGFICWMVLRAKDPKVRHAWVCEMVAGLVLQGTQVMNADPWMRNKGGVARMQSTSGDNERCRGESRRCSRRF